MPMKTKGRVVRGHIVTFDEQPCRKMADDCLTEIENGAIAISDTGRISWLGDFSDLPGEYADQNVDDHGKCLILPGFIDAHLHFPQYRMIAAYGKDLLDWLDRYTFVEEQKYQDPVHAAHAAGCFLSELTNNGITGAMVFSTIHPEALDALFCAARKQNRAIVSGKTMMDRRAPAGLCDTASTSYVQSKALIEKWHGVGRLEYAITPRFAVTSTESQLELAGTLCREFPQCRMQTHLSENTGEIDTVAKDFPWSKDYTDVYDRFGLLGSKSFFAHSIHLGERELSRLQESKSTLVHCPTSNNFLGSGLMPFKSFEDMNISLAVGCDIGGGTSFSMLQTLGEAYKVSQLSGTRLSAFDAFYYATLGNARALQMDNEMGMLKEGYWSDLVVLDPCATPIMKERHTLSGSLHDVLFALMIMGDDRAIRQTYIAGVPCKATL